MTDDKFKALLAEHLGLVHRVAYTYCRDVTERDDVAQEIVTHLWRCRAQYDGRQASTWFYRVAINVAISYFRREVRRSGRTEPFDQHAATLGDVATTAAHHDSMVLRSCIAELGEMDRGLTLLHLDGNSHAVIAEILGISASNVATRLTRIRVAMRRRLDSNSSTQVQGSEQ
ncbi:MAG: sigma-70 family RNA polymerase sigma factor [Nannocystaceae bacterium]|nr:sigma-70 family RNA polymerase sigma factor [Nannocystaceae bacterium]